MAQRATMQGADIVAMPAVDGQVVTGACVLMGGTLVNESGASVRLHVHNGTSGAGNNVIGFSANNGESVSIWFGPNGISCPDGLYINVVAGTPTGSLFYHTV